MPRKHFRLGAYVLGWLKEGSQNEVAGPSLSRTKHIKPGPGVKWKLE